jgi:hypothetical protein
MSAILCGSFAWGEKALKIRHAAGNPQIFKLISDSREHSKHRSMLQFKTMLRPSALIRQRYSLSSLKVFISNFGTEDGFLTTRTVMRSEEEQFAVLLQAEFERVQGRKWTDVYTGDESWGL